jgi:hypothetical protein
MQAPEKLTTPTAWDTVSAVMKDVLADALASGNTQGIIDLTNRIASRVAAQGSWEWRPRHFPHYPLGSPESTR